MGCNELFPFHMVEKGSRIILYGAGSVGKNYFQQLRKTGFCRIAHWIDQNSANAERDSGIENIEILKNPGEYDYLVVAVRSQGALGSVFRTIREYGVDERKIIWWDPLVDICWEYRQRLSMENLLKYCGKAYPSGEARTKVRFLCYGSRHLWSGFRSVVFAFARDERYDVRVISNKLMEGHVKPDGIPFESLPSYHPESDAPDIVFVVRSSEAAEDFKFVRSYAKLVVNISFSLINFQKESFEAYIHAEDATMAFVRPDIQLYDKYIYEGLLRDHVCMDGRYLMGNPKFDELFERLHSGTEPVPQGWEKLEGKKVFLWATDHMWDGCNVTFDLYAQRVLAYMYAHPHAGLIIRMHPSYIVQLLENGVWTQGDVSFFREYCQSSANVVWDESPTYFSAYSMADAVITDCRCGIMVSALVLDKPIAILHRYDRPAQPVIPAYTEGLYNAYSENECIEIMDSIMQGEDKTKAVRDEWMPRLIAHYDGKNGERIKDFVCSQYEEKYRNK